MCVPLKIKFFEGTVQRGVRLWTWRPGGRYLAAEERHELLPPSFPLHLPSSSAPFEAPEWLPHTCSLLFPTSASEKSLYRVLLGARQLVKPGPHATYARVKRVESNPLYEGMASSADVALVELEAPVTFTNYILPVCMPDPSVIFETGMECWVTGWGSPSEQGNGAW